PAGGLHKLPSCPPLVARAKMPNTIGLGHVWAWIFNDNRFASAILILAVCTTPLAFKLLCYRRTRHADIDKARASNSDFRIRTRFAKLCGNLFCNFARVLTHLLCKL